MQILPLTANNKPNSNSLKKTNSFGNDNKKTLEEDKHITISKKQYTLTNLALSVAIIDAVFLTVKEILSWKKIPKI